MFTVGGISTASAQSRSRVMVNLHLGSLNVSYNSGSRYDYRSDRDCNDNYDYNCRDNRRVQVIERVERRRDYDHWEDRGSRDNRSRRDDYRGERSHESYEHHGR